MNKQNAVRPYSGMSFGHKEECNTTTWINLEHIVLREKPVTGLMYDCIYMEHPEEANPLGQKID